MRRSPTRRVSRWAAGAIYIAAAALAQTGSAARGQAPAPARSTALATPATDAPRIDVARVKDHVRALTQDIGPRPTGSTGARRAARYIEQRITEIGLALELHPVGKQVLPRISVGARVMFPERTITITDDNLLVRFAGTDPRATPILFMAHYDSVRGAPGAIDNAVSVGLLIELARALSRTAPPRPVILAWTAAEERRLAGARALAAELGGRIGLAVALDLVGSREGLVLTGLSDLMGEDWLSWIASVARSAKVRVSAPVLMRLISRALPQLERSDHGPFTALGIPAFHMFHRGAARIYRPYHTRLDALDRVDDGGVAEAGRFIHALARTGGPLPRAGGSHGWWTPIPGGPHVFPTAVLVVVTILLVLASLLGLLALWRRRPRWRSKRLGLVVALPAYMVVWVSVAGYLGLAGRLADHPSPWVHRPLAYVAAAIFLAASLGVLVGWLLGRTRKVAGKSRYLAAAIIILLVAGLGLAMVDALEIAWIVLWSAAALGGVAVSRRSWQAWPCFIAALLPLREPLSAGFLREASFHGFLAPNMPLGLVLALVLVPYALAGIYMVRRWLPPLPARSTHALILVATALLIVSLCTVSILARTPRCDGKAYRLWGLSCEIAHDIDERPR